MQIKQKLEVSIDAAQPAGDVKQLIQWIVVNSQPQYRRQFLTDIASFIADGVQELDKFEQQQSPE